MRMSFASFSWLLLPLLLLLPSKAFNAAPGGIFKSLEREFSSSFVLRAKSSNLRHLIQSYEGGGSGEDMEGFVRRVIDNVENLEREFELDRFRVKSLEGEWDLLFTCNPTRGSVGDISAQGVKFGTQEKVTTQSLAFDDDGGVRITNVIRDGDPSSHPPLSLSRVEVGGEAMLDKRVSNRVNVKFDKSLLTLSINAFEVGLKFDLDISFIFLAVSFARSLGAMDGSSAWLDTTYIDESCRVGRGNKGSLFVLFKKEE